MPSCDVSGNNVPTKVQNKNIKRTGNNIIETLFIRLIFLNNQIVNKKVSGIIINDFHFKVISKNNKLIKFKPDAVIIIKLINEQTVSDNKKYLLLMFIEFIFTI
jgi:hypothetical protein